MARGNEIIVNANPKGVFMEGYIASGETPSPGTIMEIDPTVALRGGRHTFKAYAPGADGNMPIGPYWILDYDKLQGRLATTAYAASERAFFYSPVAGEEFNCLVADLSGTGDDHALGEKMIVDNSTGKLIVTTGSPESEPFVLLEAITDPTEDQLAWVMYSGH